MRIVVAISVFCVVLGGTACPTNPVARDSGRRFDVRASDTPFQPVDAPLRPCSNFTLQAVTGQPPRTFAPSRVSMFFRVLCGSQGVSGLNFGSGNFELLEDGTPVSAFESQGLVVPEPESFGLVSLLLVDLSGSISESAGGIEEVRAAIRAYVAALASAGRDHPIAVYGFDGRADLQPIAEFGLTTAQRDSAITSLSCDRTEFCVDPSTNLNGAILQGISLLEAERERVAAGVQFAESFLVVFSDGTDQAARVPFSTVRSALDATPSRIFAVGIEGEPGTETLVSIGRDGYRAGRSVEELSGAFEGVARLVSDLANSYYQVDYCSPKRTGTHELTIRAQRDGITGEIRQPFDANGFTYGCIADPRECPYGRADCDRDGMSCEVELASDVRHCGGCGVACEAGASCIDGRCAP